MNKIRKVWYFVGTVLILAYEQIVCSCIIPIDDSPLPALYFYEKRS
ncbi:MAG: hypothetical protein Q4G69_08655 [Planctomycetia bacterium]|nr:hypothetical protein [Planctomycetia bacterium]